MAIVLTILNSRSGPSVNNPSGKLFPTWLALAGFLCAVFISGCDFRKVVINEPISTQDVTFITPGETSFLQVVEQLGAPDEIEGSDEVMFFRYRFRTTKMMRINFGWILRIWSPVAPPLSMGRGDTGMDVFQVAFDSNWIAQESAFATPSKTTRFNFWPF